MQALGTLLAVVGILVIGVALSGRTRVRGLWSTVNHRTKAAPATLEPVETAAPRASTALVPATPALTTPIVSVEPVGLLTPATTLSEPVAPLAPVAVAERVALLAPVAVAERVAPLAPVAVAEPVALVIVAEPVVPAAPTATTTTARPRTTTTARPAARKTAQPKTSTTRPKTTTTASKTTSVAPKPAAPQAATTIAAQPAAAPKPAKAAAPKPGAAPKPATAPKAATTRKKAAMPAPSCTASVDNRTPAVGDNVVISVDSTVPGTPFTVTAHYKSKDKVLSGMTNGAGAGAVTFDIGAATKGYKVKVDVSISGKATCSTEFIPQ